MEPTDKAIKFNGTAGGYFLVTIITGILTYVPFIGWAFALNYAAGWYADSAEINGKRVHYTATFSEALKFVAVNVLLIIVTLGIYVFWFMPKMYRFVTDHIAYGEKPGAAVPATVAEPPVTTPPASPTDPAA